jgi:hypothetical protein
MTAFIPGIITSDQMADVQKWLPNDAADNGWDTATIMDRWTGGIVTTVRAYWYDRVQQTASWLDLSDPSGSLPITQIHRQAMEMLQYWDAWLLKYGDATSAEQMETSIPRRVSFGKIRRRYQNRQPYPVPISPSSYGPYNYSDP